MCGVNAAVVRILPRLRVWVAGTSPAMTSRRGALFRRVRFVAEDAGEDGVHGLEVVAEVEELREFGVRRGVTSGSAFRKSRKLPSPRQTFMALRCTAE